MNHPRVTDKMYISATIWLDRLRLFRKPNKHPNILVGAGLAGYDI